MQSGKAKVLHNPVVCPMTARACCALLLALLYFSQVIVDSTNHSLFFHGLVDMVISHVV